MRSVEAAEELAKAYIDVVEDPPLWEEFTDKYRRLGGIPFVSITPKGVFNFNQAASLALGEPEKVVLYFDRTNRLIGIRKDTENKLHAIALRRVSRTSTRHIHAQSFIRHYELESTVTRRIQATLQGDLLVLALADAEIVVKKKVKTNGQGEGCE